MKQLLLVIALSLVGCNFRSNQAQLVYTANGARGVDANCGTQVKDCYQLIQNTCRSGYHILFVEYTGMVEYNVTATCDSL